MNGIKAFNVLLVTFFCLCLFLCAQSVYGQEAQEKYQVISMMADQVKPTTATISPGTTVIWINESPGMVEIHFTNTGSMALTCGSPLRFVPDIEGQFISDMIPFAGVASICFLQKGEFSYSAKRAPSDTSTGKDSAKEYKGKIVVQ